MKNFAFAIENNVGNATYRQNLARVINGVSDVKATFLPVALIDRDIWQVIPGIGNNLALVASARAASALHASRRLDGCDAALIHSQSIALFSLSFMRSVPTIISTDATPANFDTLPGYPQPARGSSVETLKQYWTRLTLKASAALLAWSDWVKDSFVNDYGVPPEKVHVIPAGLDVDLWKPDPTKRLNDGKVRILFASGDFKRKGGDILLRWLSQTKYRQDVEIHMAVKERDLPDEPGVFKHYGLTANSVDLISLAQSCDLFALPTRADCSPWAVIEAQAAGLPGVSTRVGAIHDMIIDQKTGFLAPVRISGAVGNRVANVDEAVIFESLDALVGDEGLRRRMGEAARERTLEHFDSRKNTLQLLSLMRQLS